MGQELAKRGIELVYGAGNVGLMGILADATLEAGGRVIGVIPESLVAKELAHNRLSDIHIVRTMHERKALMADFADAFIALPGGFGTLDEFCEILTWAQLGFHAKPCGLLNVAGYYDPFLSQIEMSVRTGFLRKEHQDLILVSDNVVNLVSGLLDFHPPQAQKWIDRDQL